MLRAVACLFTEGHASCVHNAPPPTLHPALWEKVHAPMNPVHSQYPFFVVAVDEVAPTAGV